MKQSIKKCIAAIGFPLCIITYWMVMYLIMSPGEFSRQLNAAYLPELQLLGTGLLLGAMGFTVWTYVLFVIPTPMSETRKGGLLSGVVFLVLLMGAELGFLHFEESNAIGDRWSYKLWANLHLNKRVSFNYHNPVGEPAQADLREPLPNNTGNKKRIWFIGDSFTFGFGLANTKQTFPAVVEQLMAGRVASFNLGDGGASSLKEKETLLAYDQSAKAPASAVVWQYFGNDIDAQDQGPDLYEQQLAQNKWVQFGQRFFKAKSFLLDFLYWHYFTGNEKGAFATYTDFLKHLYEADNPVATGSSIDSTATYVSPYHQHLKPILESAHHFQDKNIPFVVIIFPFLWADGPEQAEALYTKRLAADLTEAGVAVIDLTPLIAPLPLKERVANLHDHHPSARVANITADTISRFFVTQYNF
jgi:hypothetical protein